MSYETWIGVVYLSGLAGELGVPVSIASVLLAAPWIGSVGQLLGLWVLFRATSYRRYTLKVASAARLLWVIPVLTSAYWGYLSWKKVGIFPVETWFKLTTVVACTSALLGSSSSTAWLSWVKGLIPPRVQGRFFGVRQRYVMLALAGAHLVGSYWVGWRPGGTYLGYWMLGLCAVIAAGLSTFLLAKVDDTLVVEPLQGVSFRDALKEPWANRPFRNLVFFGALFNFSVQFVGPFFPYYFTKELHIPMSLVSLWTVLVVVGSFVTSSYWGKRIDRSKDPRGVMFVCCHLIAISPVFYLVGSADLIKIIAPIEYFINGMAWSGFNLAIMTLLFQRSSGRNTPFYFSIHVATSGVLGALGNFLGGNLSVVLHAYGGFRACFALGTVLRFAVVYGSIPLLWGNFSGPLSKVLSTVKKLDTFPPS
ncbi:MFS transporter [Bdellovibrionota bacterium FG-2]